MLLDTEAGSPGCRNHDKLPNCLREHTVCPDYMMRRRGRGQVYQGLGQDLVFTGAFRVTLEARIRPKREKTEVAAAIPGI